MTSRKISLNGVSISVNTTYTNITKFENMFNTIEKPRIYNLGVSTMKYQIWNNLQDNVHKE